mmetsp:Transcript_78307/g.227141  ORF Transcript_78307/g.227141 Transcript_78307/m.227141 type:complete len:228 (-) Transcript_78307:243-926(-)
MAYDPDAHLAAGGVRQALAEPSELTEGVLGLRIRGLVLRGVDEGVEAQDAHLLGITQLSLEETAGAEALGPLRWHAAAAAQDGGHVGEPWACFALGLDREVVVRGRVVVAQRPDDEPLGREATEGLCHGIAHEPNGVRRVVPRVGKRGGLMAHEVPREDGELCAARHGPRSLQCRPPEQMWRVARQDPVRVRVGLLFAELFQSTAHRCAVVVVLPGDAVEGVHMHIG